MFMDSRSLWKFMDSRPPAALSTLIRLALSSLSMPDSMVLNHSLWVLWMNCSMEAWARV